MIADDIIADAAQRAKPDAEWIERVRTRFPTERTVDRALTAKLHRRAAAPPARPGMAELGERIAAFIAAETGAVIDVRQLRPLPGGASKEQYRFELVGGDAGVPSGAMILRLEPGEAISETDREREFQLVRAMEGNVPVAPAFWADFDGRRLGRPGMISRFVEGITKPPAGAGNVTGIGNLYPRSYRDALAPQFVSTLARIHRAPTADHDYSAFDVPEVGSTRGNELAINWWARVWHEDRYEAHPVMVVAERWLRDHVPVLDEVSLVHGDFRTGNFLFDPDSLRITAVLDWELGFFGDRHGDLAWTMFDAFTTPDETGERLICGPMPREAFIAAYERESGLGVDRARLDYFTVFMLWKAIILLLGSGARAGIGRRSHQNVLMSWVAGLGYPMLAQLLRMLEERIG